MGSIQGNIQMSCKSCKWIEEQWLVVNGRADVEDGWSISVCCEPKAPLMPFYDSPQETLERFLGMRASLILDSLQNNGQHYSCYNCNNFRMMNIHPRTKISYVSINAYPAPCQARCCYCSVTKNPTMRNWSDTPIVRENFEKLFAFLEFLLKSGAVTSSALYQVSSGEITIHPYKECFYKLFRGRRGYWFTNAFLFDEGIADSLHSNPDSLIHLSIDAGSAETWKKIKGFDNFPQVLENLKRYRLSSLRPGQITFKYIILPGLNDSMEDYLKLVEIMKSLEVGSLALSRDMKYFQELYDERYQSEREKDVNAAVILLALCLQHGLYAFVSDMFLPDEKRIIEERAVKLYESGEAITHL